MIWPLRRRVPRLPDPSGNYFVSGQVQAAPMAMMGLDAPGLLERPGEVEMLSSMLPAPRALSIGMRVVDESQPREVYPGRWGLVSTMEREGLRFYADPERVFGAWAEPIYQVSSLEGLRWVIRSGKPSWPVCDAYTIIARLPGWRRFGPHGARVAELLDAIATINLETVHRLPSNADNSPASDPNGLSPLARMRHSAAIAAVFLTAERRAAELDPEAWTEWENAFCGRDFSWNDTRWQTLARHAAHAAEAIVVPEALTEGGARERIDRWRGISAGTGVPESRRAEAIQHDA